MAFDIEYHNHTNIVLAVGTITPDTPAAFQAFLDTEPFDGFRFEILLDSPGGDVAAALELGRRVRDLRLVTRTVNCQGACALVFLSGDIRELGSGRSLRAYLIDADERLEESLARAIAEQLETSGVDHLVFAHLLAATPNRPWSPSEDELAPLGVVTPNAFSGFKLEALRSGFVAYAVLDQNARGLELVSQLTLYCRAGQAHLLLSRPERERGGDSMAQDWLRELPPERFVLRTSDGVNVVVPPESITIRGLGRPLFELALDAAAVEALFSVGTFGYLRFPSIIGLFSFTIAPTAADEIVMGVALQRCID